MTPRLVHDHQVTRLNDRCLFRLLLVGEKANLLNVFIAHMDDLSELARIDTLIASDQELMNFFFTNTVHVHDHAAS
ncbi:hypothetical protein D3C71_2107200 [compost metagenome]